MRHPDAPLGDELLTGQQVADLLGVTRGRVRQLIATDALPSIKIGRSCYVPKRDVLLYKQFGQKLVGRPRGSIQYRLDPLGRRYRIKYPAKNDYRARRRKSRELRKEWERMYAQALEDGNVAA